MVSESRTHKAWTAFDPTAELRILFSGGIESAVLMGEAVRAGLKPIPVYVSTGTRWENRELESAKLYLDSLQIGLSDKMVIRESIPGKIEEHWAYNGMSYPLAEEDVKTLKIPGRNETLLREAAGIGNDDQSLILAIGTTADNPFKDGDRRFFDKMEIALSAERSERVTIVTPFTGLTKSDVIRRGKRFPLDLTLSCIAPLNGKACGNCIKCGSRAAAFSKADVKDKYEKEELNEF
ncbi:MAG: 7-cyano-7-deazaguanine synthase [Proteobacteria bacterium]|nr:7-cyano-7-deazaguanine synthase [Pseudomonadota bacterium]